MSKQKVIEGAGAKVADIGLRELQSERAVGLLTSRVYVESKLPSNPQIWTLLDRGREFKLIYSNLASDSTISVAG